MRLWAVFSPRLGRLRLACWSGCPEAAVIRAAGIAPDELVPPPWWGAEAEEGELPF